MRFMLITVVGCAKASSGLTSFQVIMNVWKTQKNSLRSLYAGVLSPCFSVGLWKASTLGLHQASLRIMSELSSCSVEKLPIVWVGFAACISGSLSSCLCSPCELIKSRSILSNSNGNGAQLFQQEVQQIIQVVRKEGPAGFARGLPLMLLRDFPGTGAFLGSYEVVKRAFIAAEQPNSVAGFFAGLVAGPIGWIVIYPIEVVRIHWQSNGVNGKAVSWPSYLSCAKSLLAQNGWSVFVRGLPVCCLRSAIQISVTMSIFEELKALSFS
mmetsp:Transcript_374/g.699  ORF Transcript_374/g.699 Transcript_374/m.699 type:complete len:268 (+) Transcript_374:190-993(+)